MSEKKKTKRSRFLTYVGLAILAFLLFECVNVRHVKVPRELVGTWKTADTRYADKSFEIGPATVNFGTGGDGISTGFVEDIQSTPDEQGTLYTVTYSSEGTRQQVSFYYAGKGDKMIRFKNQQGVAWAKEEDD